jgi:phage/plasmid-like protein (TIGR03299 family)
MAHQLTFAADGKAEMAYVGAVPWHGLGQQVQHGAPLETWLEQARMQWEIKRGVVQFMNGSMHDYPEHDVLYRSDTNEPLSVVSDRYKVVQPREMLEFFRDLVEEEGFEIETIGSLKGGRRIWAMAKTNIADEVNAGDEIKANLLLITSCDGSLATTAKFIGTRVVCWNTQAIALTEKGREVKVRHNTSFNAQAVKGEMGLLGRRAFGEFMDRMKHMSRIQIGNELAGDLIASVLPNPGNVDVRGTRGFKKILELFQGTALGSNLPGVSGTAWGLMNAVSEFTDHHTRAHNAENRLSSSWFGPGDNLKQNTEELLLTL